MATLPTHLRNKLERAIVEARDIAEKGARQALESLAVHHYEPYGHMSAQQRLLRNHLRARARQLGDKQDHSGRLNMIHLIHECAYEHWHRMLFARFLAENHLLIEPDMGVAITLDECEELVKGNEYDKWTFASLLAQHLLPQIFRPDDPLLQISLAKEHLLKLERLLDNLEAEIFTASEAIGWVYQFWQTKRKQEINESGDKIGADELPAVTQLFTEEYMVDFMLDNTLGAWWTARHKNEPPVFDFKYLRFKDDGTPMAGTFDGWPDKVAELKCLDPCAGSGHFLVGLFERLVPMRMAEEGLSQNEAARAVLRDNIYGLEIDPRCTQLAAFALALAAWRLDPSAVSDPLPSMNIACCGLELGVSYDEWKKLAPEHGFLMRQFYDLFSNASTLGSLINPKTQVKTASHGVGIEKLADVIEQGIKSIRSPNNYLISELGVSAQGLSRAYSLLKDSYHFVATNVPFLGRGKHNKILLTHANNYFSEPKSDLSTMLMKRCIDFLLKDCTATIVSPQSWMYTQSYKRFRKLLLEEYSYNMAVILGPNAFETISGEVVNIVLNVFQNTKPTNHTKILGFDVSYEKSVQKKIVALHKSGINAVSQHEQLINPDYRISIENIERKPLLSKYAQGLHGQGTFDKECFSFNFWELSETRDGWILQQTTSLGNENDFGATQIFRWEDGIGLLYELMELKRKAGYTSGKWKAGVNAWGKSAVAVSGMGKIYVTRYLGRSYDENVAIIPPNDPTNITAIYSFCKSESFEREIKKIDRNLKASCNTIVKVPFDLGYWQKVAKEKYPNGLPEPYSADPTQWIFHGRPEISSEPLQVAVARLLGYRWPAELDDKMRLSGEARELVKSCDELLEYADDDGIVCIPSVRGEDTAAIRLRNLLIKAYSTKWSDRKEIELIQATGSSAHNLDDWLRTNFFEQHCKLFHHRPFIWHIWDGRRRDGFHALVNYHKLAVENGAGRRVLESLTYSYLNDWITRQKEGVSRGAGGADERLVAALELQKRLIAIIKGEKPHDIFVRWKPIEQQPIGWEPDINDGVRLNIRPFMIDDIPGGKTGAGILRWKPNIKWEKDRGKEPIRDKEHFPWFWENKEFKGNRVNDVHFTIAEKQEARERFKK